MPNISQKNFKNQQLLTHELRPGICSRHREEETEEESDPTNFWCFQGWHNRKTNPVRSGTGHPRPNRIVCWTGWDRRRPRDHFRIGCLHPPRSSEAARATTGVISTCRNSCSIGARWRGWGACETWPDLPTARSSRRGWRSPTSPGSDLNNNKSIQWNYQKARSYTLF